MSTEIIIHPEWDLAKRMVAEWHPIGQFMIFIEATKSPWFGISLIFYDEVDGLDAKTLISFQDLTIKKFGEFCRKWEPELKKRGVKFAEPSDN